MYRPLMSGTRRTRTLRGLAAAGAVLIGGGGIIAVASQAQAATGCSVGYSINQWSTGFTANLSVKNLGDAISNGWQLEFDYAGNQTLTQSWNSTYTQSAKHVTITSAEYNKSLPTNATVNPGFNATYSGSNAAPASFKLNGVTCNGSTGPTGGPSTTTKSPSASASPSPSKTPSKSPSSSPTKSPSSSPTKSPSSSPTKSPSSSPSASQTSGGGGPVTTWPTKKGDTSVSGTVNVSGILDGGMRRYCCIGSGNQDEDQPPMFELAPGATLQNLIIGAPAGDGVHCEATCTIKNVWWEDVGEDAATLLGTAPAGSVMTIDGGGARLASDKVFQHNGPGTYVIKNFFVDDFGKLYRSCGNCKHGYQGRRDVVLDNIVAQTGHSGLVGINDNYGDTAKISRITIIGDPNHKLVICQRFTGNNTGAEPPKSGSGPDSHCLYSESDITYK